jgi:hypothetical protein
MDHLILTDEQNRELVGQRFRLAGGDESVLV